MSLTGDGSEVINKDEIAVEDACQAKTHKNRGGIKMKRNLTCILICLLVVVMALGSVASAAKLPSGTITIICPHGAGGGTDAIARALAKAAEKQFGQNVVVVNIPGGSGAVGMTDGLHRKPDGLTVTLATVEMVLHPTMGMVPWKVSDFVPVTRVNFDPSAVTVGVDSPWQTLEEFLAHAKANPGVVKVGTSAPGTIWDLAAAALADEAGVVFNQVPYAGGAIEAIKDLLGGHIDAITVSPGEVAPYVESGKFRLLGVMNADRDAKFSEIPTLKELGYDLGVSTWRAIVAPKGTPTEIAELLHDGFGKAMQDPEFVQFMTNGGFAIGYMNPTELGAYVIDQENLFAPLLKKMGFAN